MKTSLDILRETNACVGGYGRQASFWTVRPAAKKIEYPIWLIGLIGTYDDLHWALTNSLVIDEPDFKELKARTFWPMFKHLFWTNISDHALVALAKGKASNLERQAVQSALKLTNAEQVQEWLDTYSRYRLAHPIFEKVANAQCWRDGQAYLQVLHSALLSTKRASCIEHERFPFDLDSHVPGHDSRETFGVKKKPTAVRRVDKKPAPDRVEDNYYFEAPKSINGRVVTNGERFAYVCLNRDPWPVALQFLMDKDVPNIIGSKMMLSKVSENGKEPEQFHASLQLSDPRLIFMFMHLLQGQDFDVMKACLLDNKLEEIENTVGNYTSRGDRSIQDLEKIVLNEGGDSDSALSALDRTVEDANDSLREVGPTGGSIRERRARAASDGSGDEEMATVDDDESDDEDEGM